MSLAFGAAFDAALDGPPGIGFLLVALVAFAGLVGLTKPRPAALPFFAAGLVLMGFVVVRASVIVAGLDTLGALCLFAAGASFAREGVPVSSTVRGYLARTLAVIGGVPRGIASLAPPVATDVGETALVRRIPAAAVIVLPVLAVLAILLGTADPVFGHLLTTPVQDVDLGSVPIHVIEVTGGAVAFAVLAARARRPVTLGALETTIDLTPTSAAGSWVALLVSVDLLFAAFVVVQFAYFFGGRTTVLTEQGLTFAQYARTGFWQLLAATMITGGVIAFAWVAGGRDRSRRGSFRWLAAGLVTLDLVVLVSAFRRLTLYEDAFGWTWPRLAGHATILAVGVLLVCAAVAVFRGGAAWLATATVVVATLTLVGISAVNPDALIARRNLERYARTGDLDVAELWSLSGDAVPFLGGSLASLDPCARAEVSALLRATATGERYGWASWNLGRKRAADTIAAVDATGAGGRGPAAASPPADRAADRDGCAGSSRATRRAATAGSARGAPTAARRAPPCRGTRRGACSAGDRGSPPRTSPARGIPPGR